MSSPFISICIPTYKRAHLLKKLLNSIAIQTFTNFEVLINDNSPDDSVQTLVAEYEIILPISYVKNIPAVNAVNNCIKVIQRTNAQWIKIMHDDDWFATADALEKFAAAAKNSASAFIFSAFNTVVLETGVAEQKKLTTAYKQMLETSPLNLFYLNVIGHPSVVMHKKDDSILYDGNFNWVLDIDFYMRYMQQHPGFFYIDDCLVNIGKGNTQESFKYYKNRLVEIPEYFTLLQKFSPTLPLQNKYVFHLVWNMLLRYKIKKPEQVRALGYNGPLPIVMDEIINAQKKVPRIILKQPRWSKIFMLRCLSKLPH